MDHKVIGCVSVNWMKFFRCALQGKDFVKTVMKFEDP
jgi:hypothetical protein